jgi:hypothetical protein
MRYIRAMAIEAVLQQVLKMPVEERAELVEYLIDSLEDDEVELSPEELAHLDEAIADADRAVERGELVHAAAAHGTRGGATALPHLAQIQAALIGPAMLVAGISRT